MLDDPEDKDYFTHSTHGEKAYAYNFLSENITKTLKKKGPKAKSIFKHPTGRASHFVKTLKYHGDGKVAQHGGDVDYEKK